MTFERLVSALGWMALEFVEKLGGDVRLFSESGDTGIQVRFPMSPAKESAP